MTRSPIGDNWRINYQLLAVMLLKHPNGQLPCSCSRPQPATDNGVVTPTIYSLYPHHLQGSTLMRHLQGANACYKSIVLSAWFDPVSFRIPGHRFTICCHTRYNILIGNVIVCDGTFYGQISVRLNLLNINNAKRVTVKINFMGSTFKSCRMVWNIAECCKIFKNVRCQGFHLK